MVVVTILGCLEILVIHQLNQDSRSDVSHTNREKGQTCVWLCVCMCVYIYVYK